MTLISVHKHLLESLEQEFEHKLLYRLRIALPVDDIVKVEGWNLLIVRAAIRAWIANASSTLPDGPRPHKVTAPGIPFSFYASKESSRSPGLFLSTGVRIEPAVKTLHQRVV